MDRQQLRYRLSRLIKNLEAQREAEFLRADTVYGGGPAQSVLALVWLDEQLAKARRVHDNIPKMCVGCGWRLPEVGERCLPCVIEP
jgi:hypothetical protein